MYLTSKQTKQFKRLYKVSIDEAAEFLGVCRKTARQYATALGCSRTHRHLSDTEIVELRSMYDAGCAALDIAHKLKISTSTIYKNVRKARRNSGKKVTDK